MGKHRKFTKIVCSATDCNRDIDIVLTPIQTLVTGDVNIFKSLETSGTSEGTGEIQQDKGVFSDYLVVHCSCLKKHLQRVFIK